MPGSTTQVVASAATLTTRLQYFDQSSTTASLVHWPARLVPPPRESTGAAVLAADRYRLDGRVDGARDYHADRHLAEVRAVGRVGGAAASVEADLSVDPARERALKVRRLPAAGCRQQLAHRRYALPGVAGASNIAGMFAA